MLGAGQRLTDHRSVDLTVERIAGRGFSLIAFGPNRIADGHWLALKTILPDLLRASPRVYELFVHAGLAWCALWPHPNLITAHTVVEIGKPWLVIDYAELGSLRDLLRRGPLTTEAGLRIAQMIAAGLVALHTPDPEVLRPDLVSHGDLKPENILLDREDRARITDIGLTKPLELAAREDPSVLAAVLTATTQHTAGDSSDLATVTQGVRTEWGISVGAPAYMAPEQWEDAPTAGPSSDLYAFGLILFELFAGRHALLSLNGGHELNAWRQAHLQGQPQSLREHDPELPVVAENLYQALLAKRAEDRPTATAVLAGLQTIAAAKGYEPYQAQAIYDRTDEHKMTRWVNMANAYDVFGLFTEALERLEQARALVPLSPRVLLERATTLKHMNRSEEALAAYGEALAATPAEERLLRKMMHKNRANLLSDQLLRYAEADADYAEALALVPDDASCWYCRADNEDLWGRAEAASGRIDAQRYHLVRAIQYAERGIALDPEDPQLKTILVELRTDMARLGG